jgi:hypothetical protein
MPHWRTCFVLACGLALATTGMQAQVMTRFATTLEAVLRYPVLFHDKAIAIVGPAVPLASGAQLGLAVEAPKHFVIAPRTGQPPDRPQEYRGRLFDIGRFASDDSRLGPLNLPTLITSVVGDRWPARETLFVLTGSTWSDAPAQNDNSLRAIALAPSRFEGRSVTVRGRFRGRNLFGDAPAWPRQSQWDFVVQSADAAVWVLGKRPRGDGFDLSTTNRAHTGRWLEVTGKVELRDALPVIIAESLRVTTAEDDQIEAAEPVAAPLAPPTLVFSAPAQGETAIATDVIVRFQFSRPMRPATFDNQVRVRYAQNPDMPTPAFTVTYRPAPMAIEIRFSGPLAPGAEVIVELLGGILAADGVPFGGTTLRFSTVAGAPGL